MTMSIEQAAINLAVAFCLSAAIGFERQWRNRLAGLRTNTLVALGAASFVVFVNLLLRPVVNFINRQPLVSTELEIGYVVSLTCRAPDEAHVRALLLQGLVGSGLALRGLDSNDVGGGERVCVTAHLTAPHRVDADVEKIVGRLSLEPAVTAASWQAEVRLDSESRSSLGR